MVVRTANEEVNTGNPQLKAVATVGPDNRAKYL
jgi:hypothetical protein